MAEMFFFKVENLSDEYSGTYYTYVRPTFGNGSLYFKDMPKGQYTVKQVRGNSPTHSGKLDYSLRTLGASQEVTQ